MDSRKEDSGATPLGSNTQEILAGRYIQRELLGRGGMGAVYLVEDTMLKNELLALKVIRPDISDCQKQHQRFLREILLTRKISHQHIVRTYDAGIIDDSLYFTMEYVKGVSLKCMLKEHGALPPLEVAKFMAQICDALVVVHNLDIIHRDIKPANILINEDGDVKLTDFGVARTQSSDLTAHDEVVGSTAYMAPEVWVGRDIGPPADLYSLGVMAYQLVTGKLPFEADSPAELMWQHLELSPTAPIEINSGVPGWLNTLILGLMEKDCLRRPCLAGEVKEFLDLALQGDFNKTNSDTVCPLSSVYSNPLSAAELPWDDTPSCLVMEGYIPENEWDEDETFSKLGLAAELSAEAQMIPEEVDSTASTSIVEPIDSYEEERSGELYWQFLVGCACGLAVFFFLTTFVLGPGVELIDLVVAKLRIELTGRWLLIAELPGALFTCLLPTVPVVSFASLYRNGSFCLSAFKRTLTIAAGILLLFSILYLTFTVYTVTTGDHLMKLAAFDSIIKSASVNLAQVSLLMPVGTSYYPQNSFGVVRVVRVRESLIAVQLFYLLVMSGFLFMIMRCIHVNVLQHSLTKGIREHRFTVALIGIVTIEMLLAPLGTSLLGGHVSVPRVGTVDVPTTQYNSYCAIFNWTLIALYFLLHAVITYGLRFRSTESK